MEMAAAAFLQERIWRKVYQFKYTLQTIEVLDTRGFFSFFFYWQNQVHILYFSSFQEAGKHT